MIHTAPKVQHSGTHLPAFFIFILLMKKYNVQSALYLLLKFINLYSSDIIKHNIQHR
ncbi:hypothetical protein FWK35_00014255 [Aphis craccivora]|uniref:Uncharacterized protein n=1 Tax=Aphis craccivora TaxID=307492 RepID=A0A6G0YV58_APHCR|nr:hypothetical protein FWK35_00014255 [Aphis craccivora]